MSLVFLVGTGRCGSSLIHEILARHKNVGFISNVDDNLHYLNLKGKWNNFIFRTPVGQFTKKGRPRFAPSEAYKLIGCRVSQIYVDPCRDLGRADVTRDIERRFISFFSERISTQGKGIFLHKYTGWSRIGFFSKIFPDAKFIHIVRDGRAVANSWLQMPWWGGYRGPNNWLWGDLPNEYLNEWLMHDRSFVVLAGIAWKILIDSYERSSKQLCEKNYLQVRYEDVLDDPVGKIGEILSFMSLPWTAEFGAHLDKQISTLGGGRSFEKDLTPAQSTLLLNTLSDKLQCYGYL